MLTVGGKKPDLRASDNGKLIHGEPIRGTPLNRNTAFFAVPVSSFWSKVMLDAVTTQSGNHVPALGRGQVE